MNLWQERIPDEINLWGWGEQPYFGLSIASFQYFSPRKNLYLKGEHLFNLRGEALRTWAQFRVRTLKVDRTKPSTTLKDRRILATAKLVYPYIYQIRR